MSAAGQKQASPDQSVAYVYGVARAPPDRDIAPLQLEGIIPGAPVNRLVHGGLVIYLSTVPASQFGASELRAGLADADWLRGRVLAHEKTLEELCSSSSVVPFRFCTIYRDTAELSDVLSRHQADLEHALDRVRDAAEWGIKLYYDADALRRQVEASCASIRKLHKTLTDAAPGAQFFLRKKYDRALAAEVASSIATCVEHNRRHLDACAREAVEIKVQSPAEHGRPETMVMNAAYLVDKSAFGEFQRTLAALQTEFAALGFGYALTGPWPAYHFVSSGREGFEDAATPDR